MDAFAQGLAAAGLRVLRFEFDYMAARREGGKRRPPDRQDKLLAQWHRVIEAVGPDKPVIGGKSLGGRMASLIADEVGARALLCLGYPFHPPGKPERLRTAHLETLTTPTLIVQGTRDPFGNRDEVGDYALSAAIGFHWAEDGNHDLAPRKSSGRTTDQNWSSAIDAIVSFLNTV